VSLVLTAAPRATATTIVDNPPPYSESYTPPPLPPPPPPPPHPPSPPHLSFFKPTANPYVSLAAVPPNNLSPSPSEGEYDSSGRVTNASENPMTSPPPDAAAYITQVQDHSVTLATRALAEASLSRREEEDVYCIYNMRGVRRDLRRRDAKLIPEPFAVHFKNGYMHVPWDQMTNWPWIHVSEVVGEDWEYRAIPVHDVRSLQQDRWRAWSDD